MSRRACLTHREILHRQQHKFRLLYRRRGARGQSAHHGILEHGSCGPERRRLRHHLVRSTGRHHIRTTIRCRRQSCCFERRDRWQWRVPDRRRRALIDHQLRAERRVPGHLGQQHRHSWPVVRCGRTQDRRRVHRQHNSGRKPERPDHNGARRRRHRGRLDRYEPDRRRCQRQCNQVSDHRSECARDAAERLQRRWPQRTSCGRTPTARRRSGRWTAPAWSQEPNVGFNPGPQLARDRLGRLQRRRQGRHPVAEHRRHDRRVVHERHQPDLGRERCVQSGTGVARDRHRRLQRRRQVRHPVAERRRHAGGVADEWPQHSVGRQCRLQSGAGLARHRRRRLQRRRQGRHPVAERRRHAADLADERHQSASAARTSASIRGRPGTSSAPATSTATARPTSCGRTPTARRRSG